MYLKPLMLLI
jgi:hypothetical protein